MLDGFGILSDGEDYFLQVPGLSGIRDILPRPNGYVSLPGSPVNRFWRIRRGAVADDLDRFWLRLSHLAPDAIPNTAEAFKHCFTTADAQADAHLILGSVRCVIRVANDISWVSTNIYHARVAARLKAMGGVWYGNSRLWAVHLSVDQIRLCFTNAGILRAEQIEYLDYEHEIAFSSGGNDCSDPDEEKDEATTEAQATPETEENDSEENAEEGTEPTRNVFNKSLAALPVMPVYRSDLYTRQALSEADAQYPILRDYQRVGFAHLAGQSSALLADDMGLGKSKTAVAAAAFAAGGRQILVICPATVVWNWGDEIYDLFPDDQVSYRRYDSEAKWIVCNFAALERLARFRDRFSVVIVDEGQSIKEILSDRTQLTFDTCRMVPHRMILTGTPILNRYAELHTLLRFGGHPLGDVPIRRFRKLLKELDPETMEMLSRWVLRRMKKDYLHELPPKERRVIRLDMPAEARARYQAIVENPDITPLHKVAVLRSVVEMERIQNWIPSVLDALAPDDKIIVFCERQTAVNTLQALLVARGIGFATITGKVSHFKRVHARKTFQTDPQCRVFIGTYGAAGVGINLTAANYVCHTILPWTSGIRDQAEDRAWRSGQMRPVTALVPLFNDSVDESVYALLESKHEMSEHVLTRAAARRRIAAQLADPSRVKKAA